LLAIPVEEASCDRRGFHVTDTQVRQRLETIGRAFLRGYLAAIEHDRLEMLAERLAGMEIELRGFAFEGAALGLALLDQLTPWRAGRFRAFVQGPGSAHVYMAHIGAGWVIGRLPWPPRTALWHLDPLLAWLTIDGYGFHEGYFRWRRYVVEHTVPSRLSGYARRAFDQGLGRSLWFVAGADPERIAAILGAFPGQRRPDLWSGVGLACAYAGPATRQQMQVLYVAAGAHRVHLAQGVVFAAAARARAGNSTQHTQIACETLCGLSAAAATALADAALEHLPVAGPVPRYEEWRRQIQGHLARDLVIP
jgi:enediyne biosynthesis protein E3